MCKERGHDDAFMHATSKLVKGKAIHYQTCTFILGSAGIEPRKTVQCGDYPNDKDLPADLVPITGAKP